MTPPPPSSLFFLKTFPYTKNFFTVNTVRVRVIVIVMATVTVTVTGAMGQPWLHWTVNFEITIVFCRAALATPILLATKLLGPGGKANIASK